MELKEIRSINTAHKIVELIEIEHHTWFGKEAQLNQALEILETAKQLIKLSHLAAQ